MHRTLRPLAVLLLLGACYSPERFNEDYDVVFCDKVFTCTDAADQAFLPYTNVEECLETRAESPTVDPDDEGCAFDADQAALCVEETDTLNCVAYHDGLWPQSCDKLCGEG